MAYVVTPYCLDCRYTDCVEACPVEAFHLGPRMVYINPDTCIDCDACVPACPVEAIYAEDDVPEKFKEYIEINARECENYEATDEKIDPLPTAVSLEEQKKREEEGKLPKHDG